MMYDFGHKSHFVLFNAKVLFTAYLHADFLFGIIIIFSILYFQIQVKQVGYHAIFCFYFHVENFVIGLKYIPEKKKLPFYLQARVNCFKED